MPITAHRTASDFVLSHRNPFRDGAVMPPSTGAYVKDVDAKQGVVRFYGNAFGNVDSYRDVVVPGAFTKTIREWGPGGKNRIRHLFDHNPTWRVGVTQELEEDSHGLLVTSKILGKDHSRGRDALIEYEERAITEHSIGFDIVKWEYDPDEELLMLLELRLYENSGVSWGANMETPVVDIKALQQDPLLFENMASQFQAIQRCVQREMTDDRCRELEARLSDYRKIFGQVDQALRSEFGLDRFGVESGKPPASEGTSNSQQPLTKAEAIVSIIQNLNLAS